ncbi:hypothetical protein THRCLA_03158 [Thraustotheca clavata]|uniref:Tetraspanin family protein n=1 Tax=Thraustotheca clavata TaxID=74557 RepID=A0A1W0A2W2_9STRA|nr:hypothetical protein THRCLA_03158 [Thraustotheca clavata]
MWTELSKFTLIVLNIGFVVAGALLIYIGAAFSGGWSTVLAAASNAASASVFHLVLAFGVLVLVIAFMGLMGALKRQKCLLYTYAVFVFIALVIFLIIMITGFSGASTANKWSDASYPAESAETSVGEAFDSAYCGVMVDHYCVAGSVTEAISLFSPSASSSVATIIKELGLNANDRVGLKKLCTSLNSTTVGSIVESSVTSLKTICSACQQAGQVDFSSLYDWAQDNCALTSVSAAWCVSYLNTNKYPTPDTVYPECRPSVLDLFKKFANKVAITALVFSCAALIVLIMAFVTARSAGKDGSAA